MSDHTSGFAGRSVLITGGLGFIGSTLAHRLVAAGAAVTLVDILIPEHGGNPFNIAGIEDRVQVIRADVRDEGAMRKLVSGASYLFSLAGQTSHLDSMRDPLTDLDLNARGALSLLEACRHSNPDVRVVYASTRQIYGVPEYLPVDERHPVRPVDANGISKVAAEYYHMLYAVHGVRSCALRMTNTYGPRMRIKDARQTFVGWWIRQLIAGEQILVYGDGSQMRDLNHVDDVVEALLLAATREEAVGRVFNLGDSQPLSLLELARSMTRLFGGGTFRCEPFPPDLKRIDIGSYYADASLIAQTLGWRPRVSLEDGMQSTFAYFREHWRHYV